MPRKSDGGRHRGKWDEGDRFDYQWNQSAYRHQQKETRRRHEIEGEPEPTRDKGCADKTVILLASLGGAWWALDFAVRWIA